MKQAMIDYTKNKKHDHFDTPDYAVLPLLPYIRKDCVVWEPTDTCGKSGIAGTLRKRGREVISTSKDNFDFLTDTPDFEFDMIVTNPPYSVKDDFIQRCYELRKPWAMLMPLTALEGIRRGGMWRNCGIQLLVLDRRVEFTGGSVWFNTSWFCHRVLPGDLMFAELKK